MSPEKPTFPQQPSGAEFAANAIASLNRELMAQLDLHKAKDARIAELEAELEAEITKLKNPESDGA